MCKTVDFFPESWEDFIKQYCFEDINKIYTDGSSLIPVFRVIQMMQHYLPENYIEVGKTYTAKDFSKFIIITENESDGTQNVTIKKRKS